MVVVGSATHQWTCKNSRYTHTLTHARTHTNKQTYMCTCTSPFSPLRNPWEQQNEHDQHVWALTRPARACHGRWTRNWSSYRPVVCGRGCQGDMCSLYVRVYYTWNTCASVSTYINIVCCLHVCASVFCVLCVFHVHVCVRTHTYIHARENVCTRGYHRYVSISWHACTHMIVYIYLVDVCVGHFWKGALHVQ